MAIVTFAAPVSGLRGKVGGNVFSANKSGPYLKAWGRGSNPRTDIQTNHRGDLILFSQAWQNLTAAERTTWDVYAALPAQDKTNSLGETFSASGFNWFVAINLNRRRVGQGQLNTAPLAGTPATPIVDFTLFRSTANPSTTVTSFNVASPNLAFDHIIKAVVVASTGHTKQAEIRPFIKDAVPSGPSRIISFKPELEDRFGTLIAGQRGFFTAQSQSPEGRRSTVAQSEATAT